MLGRLFRQLFRSRSPQSSVPPSSDALISAVTLQQAGDYARAEAACRSYLEAAPGDANALHLLGSNLLAQARFDEATETLQRAVEVEPRSGEAHYNLALAHKGKGDSESALASFRAALKHKPEGVEACLGAGTLLHDLGRFDEAESFFRQAIARRPKFAEAHYSLGVTLASLQRFSEAIAEHRAALAIRPHFLLAHSNLLFLLNAQCAEPRPIYDEHRAWDARYAGTLGTISRYSNTADPVRRLRVGYVSTDFWHHPVGRFMEPILELHDKKAFEIVCYHSHRTADAVTARLRRHTHGWIDCATWSDDELAKRIRADAVDVLVDLGGHTSGSRLLAFARKPAPVQATYLGYPTTTGLAAIDYRITDRTVDPVGAAALNAETPVRLPHSYFCYPGDADGELALSPRAQGVVTFGSFNACIKWSDETLALWARVMSAVPDAKLVLKAKDLSNARVRERVIERFAALGLEAGRITLLGWEARVASHLGAYEKIDVALDTFPYNGATTTCEALWMGVPVVTLQGATHASRMAASAIQAAGFPELIAESPDRYVEICTTLAADREKLAGLRAGLRARMRASPLMDAAGFTKALELEYRRLWRAYCGQR